jgi:hypothetical protein
MTVFSASFYTNPPDLTQKQNRPTKWSGGFFVKLSFLHKNNADGKVIQ